MTVKKSQMIREIRKRVNIARKEIGKEVGGDIIYVRKETVAEIVNALIDVMELHLKNEEPIALPPLGRLEIKVEPKTYYDFTTGETTISKMVSLKFKSTHLRKYFKEKREEEKEEKREEEERERKEKEVLNDLDQVSKAESN